MEKYPVLLILKEVQKLCTVTPGEADASESLELLIILWLQLFFWSISLNTRWSHYLLSTNISRFYSPKNHIFTKPDYLTDIS